MLNQVYMIFKIFPKKKDLLFLKLLRNIIINDKYLKSKIKFKIKIARIIHTYLRKLKIYVKIF
jgi:hypothetical protein